jgi:hypothetical protein
MLSTLRKDLPARTAIRLIALLNWYDETPAFLHECVESLATVGVDHLVAVDGAYHAYPDAKPTTGTRQAHTFHTACARHRIGCTVHTPQAPWAGNELEKRTFLFRLAHTIATPTEDWLLVADADELWEADTPTTLRTQLEQTPHDVATLHIREYVDTGHTNRDTARKAFRAHPTGIRVHGAHYIYVDGDNRVLWGVAGRDIPAHTVHGVHVTHRPAARPTHRTTMRNQYYTHRAAQRLEASAWDILHSAW